MSERFDNGMKIRRSVLGDAHVDRAEAAKTAFDEPAMHVRASANTGASPEDLREAMMHVAVYAGVPAANHALKIIKKTYGEMGVEI